MAAIRRLVPPRNSFGLESVGDIDFIYDVKLR